MTLRLLVIVKCVDIFDEVHYCSALERDVSLCFSTCDLAYDSGITIGRRSDGIYSPWHCRGLHVLVGLLEYFRVSLRRWLNGYRMRQSVFLI